MFRSQISFVWQEQSEIPKEEKLSILRGWCFKQKCLQGSIEMLQCFHKIYKVHTYSKFIIIAKTWIFSRPINQRQFIIDDLIDKKLVTSNERCSMSGNWSTLVEKKTWISINFKISKDLSSIYKNYNIFLMTVWRFSYYNKSYGKSDDIKFERFSTRGSIMVNLLVITCQHF